MKISGFKPTATGLPAISQTTRKAVPIAPEQQRIDRPGSVSRLIILGHFDSFKPIEVEARLNQVAGLRADYWGPEFLESMGIPLCDLPYELSKDNPELIWASRQLTKSQLPSAPFLTKLRNNYKYGGWIIAHEQANYFGSLEGARDHLLFREDNPVDWLLTNFFLP